MKSLVVVCATLFAVGMAFEDTVRHINQLNTTWKAEVPSRFASLDDVRQLCGTWLPGHPNYKNTTLPQSPHELNPLPKEEIPDSFDSRKEWPKCTTIGTVRDQSACGSCWAFGATEAFEDSRCIATGDSILFSAEDTTGCCNIFNGCFSMGCGGGQPSMALSWMVSTGVVTGGDYFNRTDKSDGCQPYSLAPCAHHVPPSSKYPACPSDEYTITCQETCTNKASGKTYSTDKTKGVKATSFFLQSVQAMQTAIMKTGPLAVAFTVYGDFPTYKSGVYQHKSGDELGGHAVEMIGWGVENGTPYWLIKNSWNEQWGDQGFFKILRGSDECGIESNVNGINF